MRAFIKKLRAILVFATNVKLDHPICSTFFYMEWAKGGRPQRPWRPHGPSGPDGPRGLFIVFACHWRPKVIEAHHTYFLSREYAGKKSKKVERGDQP